MDIIDFQSRLRSVNHLILYHMFSNLDVCKFDGVLYLK